MNIQWFDREALDRIIVEHIQHVDVVLDIGCGIRPQTFFRPLLHICCEPHPEYVQILQNYYASISDIVILRSTAQEIMKVMPDDSVDSVFLVDFIEHLEKDEGRLLLLECKRIARKQIVLFTPLGFMPQVYEDGDLDGWGLSGGKWQVHKSGWTPDDFDGSWKIFASLAYHTISGRGEEILPPFGAFWAIKNIAEKESISFPVKLAVLSHNLPPSHYGQATMLYRLLKNFIPNDYCLLSREDYDYFAYLQKSLSKSVPISSPRLPARYYHLPPEIELRRPNRLRLSVLRESINILLRVLQRAKNIISIVKKEKCGAILACSGDLYDLPAGYLASQLSRIPFYAYIFDNYAYQWTHRLHRFFARWVEPIVLKAASGVIVPNEFLSNEYRRLYRVKSAVLHNPYEIPASSELDDVPWPSSKEEIKIVYTGAVYHAHYDAFHNLIDAIQQLSRPAVKLHIYTIQPQKALERENICGPIVYHAHVAHFQIFEIQRRADILFLPLAFNSMIPEVIRSSAPAKMGEYLASGRPVLVHAPADSFVSWYFNKYKCGVVVDQNEPKILVEAIRCILCDEALRQSLGKNAQARAKADFDLTAAQACFLRLLNQK